MSERTDHQLLSDHLSGDRRAFEELVHRHRDHLWSIAYRSTGDRQLAEDALQEALLNAYRKAQSFHGTSAVSSWLYRIVVNAAIDVMRKRKDHIFHLYDDLPDKPRHSVSQPDTVLDTHILQWALQQLPVEQKIALVLVDVEGLPVDQAADIAQVPPGTIKSRCARGRKKMATILHDSYPDRATKM